MKNDSFWNPRRDVINIDRHKACILDEEEKTVEIKIKKCITLIKYLSDGKFEVINTKN